MFLTVRRSGQEYSDPSHDPPEDRGMDSLSSAKLSLFVERLQTGQGYGRPVDKT